MFSLLLIMVVQLPWHEKQFVGEERDSSLDIIRRSIYCGKKENGLAFRSFRRTQSVKEERKSTLSPWKAFEVVGPHPKKNGKVASSSRSSLSSL